MLRPEKSALTAGGPDAIRNICILAHVDHGKTTIADSLIAVNGHISKRSAGNARYLDDRRDEQERGITMKSSAISLVYEQTVINLIDTPGHIDFSTEVSAAIRICDGALIVVDVVEGVCVQTREALKQAFDERIKTILVINKLDRIIVEQRKDADVIFQHILRIIEDCNAYVAELCQYDLQCTVAEEDYLFAPDAGNVIFASAYDGWGVTTRQVAEMFAETLGVSVEELNGKMWDFDYYVSKGKITPGAIDKKKPNLFMSLFLSTVHYVYFTLRIRLDRSKYPMIIEKLKITKETVDMKHSDARIQVKAILQAWKPLAATILDQVKVYIPAPTQIIAQRYEYLVNRNLYLAHSELAQCADDTINTLSGSSSNNGQTTIVYVSKMFAASRRMLQQQRVVNIVIGKKKSEVSDEITEEPNSEDVEEVDLGYDKSLDHSHEFGVLALARVFSGILNKGEDIFIQSPHYKPPPKDINIDEFLQKCGDIKKVPIKQLYILLGRELIAVDSVSAGNICGIHGLEKHVARTGTLSTSLFTVPLTERMSLEPIVRNSIECQNPKELPLLRKGLQLLKQIDSCVEVAMQETGEMVLVTAGDVHLAKCIEDMRTMIADIEINVSKPMVAIKESLVAGKRLDFSRPTPMNVEMTLKDIGMHLSIVAVPLPESIVNVLTHNYDILKLIENYDRSSIDGLKKTPANEVLMTKLRDQLKTAFAECKGPWVEAYEQIWALSKKRDFCNVLVNKTGSYARSIFTTLDESDVRACLDHCIVTGFEMCCRAGPICEEPIANVAFVINEYRLENYAALQSMDNMKVQIVGNIPLAVKDAMREAFSKQPNCRLMEPIFTTDIQVNTRILGKVYSVVNRRHGRVLEAVGMDDLEKTFLVKAQLPVAESHGFANEMRKTTSGQANPNLRFSHYEIIDGDPFYNFEEVEDDDDDEDSHADASKRASMLRKEIRKRKGLRIDDQVVVHAEKQRTLKK